MKVLSGSKLQSNVRSLEVQYNEITGKLAEVHRLLKRADARRVAPNEDRSKWNQVIDNLEKSLNDLRSKESLIESELRAARRLLQQDLAEGAETATAQVSIRSTAELSRATSVEHLAEHILDEPVRTVDDLSLEQMSRLKSHLTDGAGTAQEEKEQAALLSRVEQVNQMQPRMIKPKAEENRHQFILRAAIDKLKSEKLDVVSYGELKLLFACYSLLSKRLEPTANDRYLQKLLEPSIKEVQRTLRVQ